MELSVLRPSVSIKTDRGDLNTLKKAWRILLTKIL